MLWIVIYNVINKDIKVWMVIYIVYMNINGMIEYINLVKLYD